MVGSRWRLQYRLARNANWLWHGPLAVPPAEEYRRRREVLAWATGKHYLELVAGKEAGPRAAGMRTSLQQEPGVSHRAAAVRRMLHPSTRSTRPTRQHPREAVPYVGGQFAAIPSSTIATSVGQQFSAARLGKETWTRAEERTGHRDPRDDQGRVTKVILPPEDDQHVARQD